MCVYLSLSLFPICRFTPNAHKCRGSWNTIQVPHVAPEAQPAQPSPAASQGVQGQRLAAGASQAVGCRCVTAGSHPGPASVSI